MIAPIDEISVMAKEEAIVTLVGIFKTVSIIGTNRNAPPAPTIPAPIPTTNASDAASHLLIFICSKGISSSPFSGLTS